MQTIGNLFTILIFISAFGGLFTLSLLFAAKVLKLEIPFWVNVMEILFYLLPFVASNIKLIPPEEQLWTAGFWVAYKIWFAGVIVFLLFFIVLRYLLAWIAVKKFAFCDDQRIRDIFTKCSSEAGLKKAPELMTGNIGGPACAIALRNDKVILSENFPGCLSDDEIAMILAHELIHIKRKHLPLQKVYDVLCCFHWFNPFIWIARNDFSVSCEIDCDSKILSLSGGNIKARDYASVMLKLMELSSVRRKAGINGMGAMDYLIAKQRFQRILKKPSTPRCIAGAAAGAILIALTLYCSVSMSRTFFYPYSAHTGKTELSGHYAGRSGRYNEQYAERREQYEQ